MSFNTIASRSWCLNPIAGPRREGVEAWVKNIWKKITCASVWGREVCPFRGAETPFHQEIFDPFSAGEIALKFPKFENS